MEYAGAIQRTLYSNLDQSDKNRSLSVAEQATCQIVMSCAILRII